MGTIGRVDAVEITWPGGKQQTLTDLPVGRWTVVEEPK
jgi:ASPIC and UnbV